MLVYICNTALLYTIIHNTVHMHSCIQYTPVHIYLLYVHSLYYTYTLYDMLYTYIPYYDASRAFSGAYEGSSPQDRKALLVFTALLAIIWPVLNLSSITESVGLGLTVGMCIALCSVCYVQCMLCIFTGDCLYYTYVCLYAAIYLRVCMCS